MIFVIINVTGKAGRAVPSRLVVQCPNGSYYFRKHLKS